MITSLIVETYKDTGKLNIIEEFVNVKIPVYETPDIISYVNTMIPSTKDGIFVFKAFDENTQALNQRVVTPQTFKY